MKLRIGYELAFDCLQQTPMLLMLKLHSSTDAKVLKPDELVVSPAVDVEDYEDRFGNRCSRIVAPAGRITICADGVLEVPGDHETIVTDAAQHPIEDLPQDCLVYLMGSRYCETDKLSDIAWSLFGATPPGARRVQAIIDFVHAHLVFDYKLARPTRTAVEAYEERSGVCRDFAHLTIAFCRAMNIPARYCTGYISDINLPPTDAPMDFCAWIEVYLGGKWCTYDPRNNAPRTGRVLIGRGRDAADVAITSTFGTAILTKFEVVCEEDRRPDIAHRPQTSRTDTAEQNRLPEMAL